MADLGDISRFMKEGNVSNLDWLDVSEKEYAALETLPKQNLDTAPDMEALWARDDSTPQQHMPNRADLPKTMGDLSEAHGLLRAAPEDIRKVARLSLMQSDDPARIKDTLVKRFDSTSLKVASGVLSEVFAERGLLGRFYIDAADFPTCASGSKKPIEFVRRYASEARYVKTKAACAGCTHAMQSPTGGQTCATFHKELKVEVPYTEALAEAVERSQQSKGKAIKQASADPRERIRLAMLAPAAAIEKAAPMPKPKEAVLRLLRPVEAVEEVRLAPDLTRPKEAAKAIVDAGLRGGTLTVQAAQQLFRALAAAKTTEQVDQVRHMASIKAPLPQRIYSGMGEQPAPVVVPQAEVETQVAKAASGKEADSEKAKLVVAARKAQPVLALLRREMLKGRSEAELTHALHLAFRPSDLDETAPFWEPLYRQAGAYGVVYITQDSFGECREGADFIAKHNPGLRAVVRGSKCSGCIYAKVGRCLLYAKSLVTSVDDVVNAETVTKVLQEHKMAGRIAPWDDRDWGQTPSEALANIHTAAAITGGPSNAQTRTNVVEAFRGQAKGHSTGTITRRDIVAATRMYMNEGLYGRDLLALLKSRFEVRDLKAAAEDLKPVVAEQGLQGIYYVDPAVYDDYGKGCDKAASLHRSRGVPYLKVGSKCSSCVLQTRPGFCSKINKQLVVEPPYTDKRGQQREMLASGRSTEVAYADLVNNGRSMMAEYEIQQQGMMVEVDPVIEAHPIEVSFK